VKSFFKNKFEPHENFLNPKKFNKIYAVGFKTKLELRKQGFGTFKVAKHASDLADFIIDYSQKEKFLHFCGNLALDVLDKTLPLQNISYKKVTVYKTNLLYPKISEKYDAIVFFSPSGVRSFAKFNSLENLKIFSIGQTTEKELKKFTQNRIFTSKESNLEDLLNIIKQKAES
jgi:uroporphyrinogen-III synthase